MKYIVVFIMIISTFINADEINRIESIVDDITKLRIELKECNNDKLKVQKFEKQLNKYKKLLISKEKEIEKLRKRKKIIKYKEKIKVQECKTVITDKPNKFPVLILKDKYNKQK